MEMHERQQRVVRIDPGHAEAVVHNFCAQIGFSVRDAYAPAEVVEMLTKIGYAVRPRTLREFIEKRYIDDPGETWDCSQIYALAGALKSRRRWLPTPCVHDAKKTGMRLQIEQLRAMSNNEPIEDLDNYSVEDLLLMLVGLDNRMEREAIYEGLRLKLAGYEE